MSKQGYSSIGVKVALDETELNYVTGFGDMGGAPASLDSTCLLDSMKHSVLGVQDVGNFEIDYLFDNSDAASDFRVIKGMEGQTEHTLKITLPDGTKFETKGTVSTWVTAVSVNNLIAAKASVALAEDWKVTNPV